MPFRNSHSHRIFQYVGSNRAETFSGSVPQYLAGLGHAQRNGNGFRAADRRNDLSFYQSNNLLRSGFESIKSSLFTIQRQRTSNVMPNFSNYAEQLAAHTKIFHGKDIE